MRAAERSPRRALGYVWNPRGPTALRANGADLQRRIAEVASARGLELLGVIKELPASDSNGVETGTEQVVLLDLLERARRGEFEVLILGTGTGLSNESARRAFLEQRLHQYGVEVEWVAGGEHHEPSVDIARDVLSAVNELERALLARQLRAGKARKKALGRHVHGRLPYGYRSNRGVLQPIEDLAPIAVRIFSAAANSSSPSRIARELNEEKIPPPQGGRGWSEQGVRVILANPAYAGERYGVRDAHPALVDRRLWNEAQKVLRPRRRE